MSDATFPLRIGLLGGGQLARMLALKAHEMGLQVAVFSERADDPAAQVVNDHHRAELDDAKALKAFLARVDVATYESEFLDVTILRDACSALPTKIHPAPELMGRIQDRKAQKEMLDDFGVPTLPFLAVDRAIDEAAPFLAEQEYGIVLKKRRFGYDGYGTYVVKNLRELAALNAQISQTPFGFIAEPLVKFKRELALTLVRGLDGACVAFPLVETKQVNSRCFWVKGPARHPGLWKLTARLKRFVKKSGYVGVITFELFDTGRGLIVNEVAPRVHNSAHYSLDALDLDQFTAHLKAITGCPIAAPQTLTRGFAMVNLLGRSRTAPRWQAPLHGHVHWYGKSENRPGRKMGHLNTLADSPDKALRMALKAEREFRL